MFTGLARLHLHNNGVTVTVQGTSAAPDRATYCCMPRSLPVGAILLLSCVLLVGASRQSALAADPQPYALSLQPTGNSALDTALHDSSSLISLQDKAPVAGFALVQRARQDVDAFTTALHSFGYYKAAVQVTIDGRPIDDPTLPDLIARAPDKPKLPVKATFTLGPQFHFGSIDVEGGTPIDPRPALQISPGQPAVASDVLAAQQRLLSAIRDAGYPLAKVDLEPVTLHLPSDTMDVRFLAQSGPHADFGAIAVSGLKDVNESFVRRRLTIHSGEPFSPAAIEDARKDLASLGVFSVVRIGPAEQLAPDGSLPLTVDVTERKKHAVDIGAAYSTDLGINITAGWHDRNLFGNAEQLNLTAAIQAGGLAVSKPGYQFNAQFIKPDFLARDQSLEADFSAFKQSLQAYDQRGFTQKVLINRKLSPHWTASGGVAFTFEDVTQEGIKRHYNLIGLPMTVRYDSTDSLLDPTRGIRLAFSLTPTGSFSGKNAGFVIMQVSGSGYLNIDGQGRSVLALRGLVGEIPGTNLFALPPDQRFYAGGSATVRGYRYQSIGPHFPDRRPTGGTAVSAGTIEFRQRILKSFGAVAFIDAGQVTENGAPFTQGWRIGAGVGARYYTSIGPLRLDVAVPLNRQRGGDIFELYLGIGQAF